MKASELISRLQHEIEIKGDLPVYISQICSDEEGECTLAEFVDTVVDFSLNPFFMRIGDFID